MTGLIVASEFSGSCASYELRVSEERRAREKLSRAAPVPVKDVLVSAPMPIVSLTQYGFTHTHTRFLSGNRESTR